jgi:large subunit ribosomal protein L10
MAIVAKKIQETKVKAIGAIKETFSASEDFIFTDYRGLTVAQITELRKQLRVKGAQYKVVKNNFARLAYGELGKPEAVANYLTGPTAIVIAPRDSNEAAKILFAFKKEAPVLEVKGGLIGESIYSPKEIEAFSKLPGKLELISQLMSVINGPARGIAAALNAVPSGLARAIKAVTDQKAA